MTWALFGDGAHEEFAPLGHTRALFDVKVGPLSRFQEHANPPEILLVRDYLHKVMEERHPGCEVNPSSADSGTVFINALADPRLLDFDRFRAAPRFLARSGGRIVAAKLSKNDSEKFIESVTSGGIFRRKFAVEENYDLSRANERVLISHPWEVIRDLKDALVSHASAGEPDANWKFIGKNPPKVHPSAKIEDGVVFDTTKGNIQIGAETTISPCRIVGPATIGERTVVKQYSIIETSAIGTDCRIAGEVEHSIISDYSNKAHAGFVGHSHVGKWVNLGAMTTTSDLKLTYGNVKMARLGRKIDTGMGKLGAFFGDMVKTSIGTLV